MNWDEVCGAGEDVDSAKLIHLVVDVLGWFLCGPLGFQPSSLTTNFAITY